MDNRLDDNVNVGADGLALRRTDLVYGAASGADAARIERFDAAVTLTFADQLSYLFAEYVKGILFVAMSTFFIFAVPVSVVRRAGARAMIARILKRGLDIAGAVTGLIVTLPLWIIVPITIKLSSPGPVFYTQTRVGINRRRKDRRYHQRAEVPEHRRRDRRRDNNLGTPFKVVKFRTMVNDAEKHTGPVWACRNDARITKVGAFLRKTRIDEIPQFLNILKGEMALVGPRPERPAFVRNLSVKVDDYAGRLQVKPGLTGLAQVECGYDSSISTVTRKVKCDLDYIKNWSLWADIKILFRTVVVVITGKGSC